MTPEAGPAGSAKPTGPAHTAENVRPKIVIERVNEGWQLVDCSECGTLGVWPSMVGARYARDQHKISHQLLDDRTKATGR